MIPLSRLLPPALLMLVSSQVLATDIVACVVADTQNNPSYYGMATTVTRLKCEFANKDYFPTLPDLYRQGWRLIQVLGGDHALSQGTRAPSPLYLLERDTVPATPAPASNAAPAPKAGPAGTPAPAPAAAPATGAKKPPPKQ